MTDLFTSSASVQSDRILYTPSSFARSSLLHLQEVGTLKALKPHTSSRDNLKSFLLFVVKSGSGELIYEGMTYQLKAGDCVFIDCKKAYSHRTCDELWSLMWCHFYSPLLSGIYEKYMERGGKPVFHPNDCSQFVSLLKEVYELAASADYIRDMRINEKLNCLLTLIMEESWHPEKGAAVSRKRKELTAVKDYLDTHYTKKISLDELAERFYINKFYLTKIFKEVYGTTVNGYVIARRITRAKQLLRFSELSVEEVGKAVGMPEPDYFSRVFKKIEGISPREYRKKW